MDNFNYLSEGLYHPLGDRTQVPKNNPGYRTPFEVEPIGNLYDSDKFQSKISNLPSKIPRSSDSNLNNKKIHRRRQQQLLNKDTLYHIIIGWRRLTIRKYKKI